MEKAKANRTAHTADLRAGGRKIRESIRARAYGLFRQGARGCDAARRLGVRAATVNRWFRAFRAVDPAPPKVVARSILSPGRMEELRQALLDKEPLDFSLPYRRWSYAAVAELVEAKFGLKVSRVTAGKWLAMYRGIE